MFQTLLRNFHLCKFLSFFLSFEKLTRFIANCSLHVWLLQLVVNFSHMLVKRKFFSTNVHRYLYRKTHWFWLFATSLLTNLSHILQAGLLKYSKICSNNCFMKFVFFIFYFVFRSWKLPVLSQNSQVLSIFNKSVWTIHPK